MALVRRGSAQDAPFAEPVGWLADDPWPTLGRWRQEPGPVAPLIDVREADGEFVIHAQMPGARQDELDVSTDGHTLVIRAPFGDKGDDSGEGRFWVRERPSGTYARAITLPATIDASALTATFENAELTVTLPKVSGMSSRRVTIGGRRDEPGSGAAAGNGHVGVMNIPAQAEVAAAPSASSDDTTLPEADQPAEPVTATVGRRFGFGGDRRRAVDTAGG